MLPGWSNCSSAKLLSMGIFQVLVSNLVHGVLPVMWDKMAQLSVVCQCVCLDLKCIETLWYFSVFTLDITCIDACVWILDNIKRSTHLSVMKCDWEALSNNILHGTYCSDLFGYSKIAVASRIWFLGLPLIEKYVLTSAVELPHASAGPLVVDPVSLIDCLPVYVQECVMSLVIITAHLFRTCVIPCKWLQAIAAESWLLDMI